MDSLESNPQTIGDPGREITVEGISPTRSCSIKFKLIKLILCIFPWFTLCLVRIWGGSDSIIIGPFSRTRWELSRISTLKGVLYYYTWGFGQNPIIYPLSWVSFKFMFHGCYIHQSPKQSSSEHLFFIFFTRWWKQSHFKIMIKTLTPHYFKIIILYRNFFWLIQIYYFIFNYNTHSYSLDIEQKECYGAFI